LNQYLTELNGELWLTEDEQDSLKISYRIKEVVYEGNSNFQHVLILDSYDFGRMLVLDGVVQTTALDGHIYNEMITHVPLSVHPAPKKILIIGGGDCGAARETCKYEQVEKVHMVEIDQQVVEVCKKHLHQVSGNLSDPRVEFIYEDGVAFVNKRKGEYDIIIVDSSDPVGPAQDLFEESFYKSLHQALKEDGLMVCQSQSPIFHADIMEQSYRRISGLFAEAKLYTAVIPTDPGGLWSFIIGAKTQIVPAPLKVNSKQTSYVNEQIIANCFVLPQFMIQKK
jgi:spermidine synthase